MTDAWRAAVADTIRTLIARSQQAYESNDCEAAGDVAWLPDRPPLVHFSAEDRVFRLENREEIIAYCKRIAQGRLSTHEEIEEQTVHLLTPHAAYVVTRSVATTRSRDGRTEVTPTVETAIAARQDVRRFWNGWAEAATTITQILAGRGVKLLNGQDGIDPAGTAGEMELLVAAGIPAADVLRAATLHPAQWLKLDHQIGSLQVGRRADLVIVGDNPLRDMTTLRSPLLVLQGGTVRRRAGL